MADSILNIVIRAQNETQSAFTIIQQQLKGIQEAVKGIGNSSGSDTKAKEGIDGIGDSAKNTTNTLKDFKKQSVETALSLEALGGIATKVAGLFAGFFTVSFIKSLADGAARTEVLGTVLLQVSKTAGITAETIQRVDKEVQALGITAESSRQSLSQFVQSGLDITKATALARAAQDLAVVAGRDSSQTFQQMITSIQQMNTVSLRFMGVIVDIEQATARYAAANGVSASSISRTTKQQIFMNEVLEQSLKLQGIYEASLSDVGKQLTSMERYQKEAADSAGNLLLPAYLVLVQEFTLFLKQITLVSEGMKVASDASMGFADVLRPLASILRTVTVAAIENAAAIIELSAAMYTLLNYKKLATIAATFLAGSLSAILKIVPALIAGWGALNAAFAASPIGMTILAVTALGVAIHALWKMFSEVKDPKTATEQLAVNFRILNDLAEKQLRAQVALENAKRGIGSKSVQDAETELKGIKANVKEVEKQNEELIKKTHLNKDGVAAVKEAADAEAEAAKKYQDANKQIQDINEKLIKMGVYGESARKGLDISAGFDEKVGAFKAALQAMRDELKNLDGSAVVSQGHIDLLAKNIIEAASTTDEMRAAFALLANEGAVSLDKLAPKLAALQLKEAAAGAKMAQEALNNFLEKSEQAAGGLSTLTEAEGALRESTTTLITELLKVGVAAGASGQGIDALKGKLEANVQTQAAAGQAERQALRETAEAVDRRYKNELAQIQTVRNAKIEAASKLVGEGKGTADAVAKADTEAATKSVAAAKTKFDAMVKMQRDYLALAIKTANEIKALDEAIANSKKTQEEKIFNLALKGKTEKEQQLIILGEIQKKASEAEAARLLGNFELAKKLNDQRIALVERLGVDSLKEDGSNRLEVEKQIAQAAEQTNGAYEQQQAILKQQQAIKKQSLEEDIDGYAKATQRVKEIGAELTKFAKEQIITLDVELKAGSLDGIARQIQNALSNLSVTLQIKAEKVGFASGGLVTGPGTTTSDSILAALSNREFVMNANAVERYGVNFMHAINQMALPEIPRFALGGLVGSSSIGDTKAASGSGGRDTVDVNLNLGGQKISLMGERTQVRRLVSSLKNLQGV